MSYRPRFLSSLVAIFAFVGATQVASCALDIYGTEQPEQVTACLNDANCDDKNPCTIDTCQADGTCARPNATNGPLAQQTAGDCRRDDCVDGVLVPTNDDADIADDNEPCTTDTCSNGNPVHTALADDTMCTQGTAAGKCVVGVCTVECSPTKPCDDQNPCTQDTCNASLGACTFSPLDGLPTPGFQEPVGDCQIHICANGIDAPLNDDADVFDDSNSCTQNVCTNGVPSNPPVSVGTPCVVGQPNVCDGAGACVECNVPADCVGLPVDDDCQKRTCSNHMCGQTFTTMGTPISNQKAGDCKQVVCNGTGSTLVQNLDTDVPEDNNPCTKNVCTSGVPSNPNEAVGFSCGSPLICDGNGKCVGCNVPTDCSGTDDFCKARTCISQTCGYDFTAAGTDLPTGQTSMDCKVVECDGLGNIVTNVDLTDKPVDGNQCTQDSCSAQGVPSNPFEPVNTTCAQNGGTVCNGAGACKKANGDACSVTGDCLSGFCVDGVCCDASCSNSCTSCNVPGNVGKCVNVPKGSEDAPGCTGVNSCDGAGVCKKDDGQGCSLVGDCVSNFCIDGVCCASACTTACRSCNLMGSVGVCTPITSGEDIVPANVCNGMKACDSSGACKSKDGQTCATGTDCVSGQCYDGVCCNVACSGTCKSCNLAGAVGICSNIPAGQNDSNGVPACTGTNQACDGMGTCKKQVGQACAATAECLSGFCVDGFCCSTACSGTCQACNLTGSIGTCSNVALGQDDIGTCSGTTLSCDGAGACKSELGVACSTSANCLSNSCVDGYCCNTACTETCKSCGLAATLGVCSFIPSGQDDTVATMTCSGTNQSCDGAGGCKKENGQTCTAGSECLSTFCADGVCCNSACGNSATNDCQACSTATGATTNGTCSPLAAGTVCRTSAGTCDVAETCDGTATACPANGFVPSTTVCRPAASGGCDVAENCTGTSAACPADTFLPSSTVCRPATTGGCDVAENCTGTSAACPVDAFLPSTTVCRPAASGGCDVAETCTGTTDVCPTDAFLPSTTVCRPAASGGCDVAETCTGTAAACPTDAFLPSTTVCRAAIPGGCDIAENCTGSAAACPTDVVESSSTVCRPATDMCDVDELCTGSSPSCPTDVFAPNTSVCRPSAGDCDAAETCTGTTAACPADALESSTFVCRSAAGSCDIAETCTGMSTTCPADVLEPSTTECRPVAGGCDIAETCTGASAQCPTDTFEASTKVCRPAADMCDVDELCTGSSATCPTDAFKPNTTVCRPSMGQCDIAETCTGTTAVCPSDALEPTTTVCRPAVDTCDVDETCTGLAVDCPTDAFAATGTMCSAQTCSNSTVTNPRTCDGSGACVSGGTMSCGNYACNGTGCYTSCTTNAECAMGFTCNGTTCQ